MKKVSATLIIAMFAVAVYVIGCGGGSTITTPLCGNGSIESGETCDDGNITAGDGCSSSCQVETTGNISGTFTTGSISAYDVSNTNSGSYGGTINVSNITLKLDNTSYEATTDSSGGFLFSSIPAGTYDIKIGAVYGPQVTVTAGNTATASVVFCSQMSKNATSRMVQQVITPLSLQNIHNYPNPFNVAAGTSFNADVVSGDGSISFAMDVYDLSGVNVTTLNNVLNFGTYVACSDCDPSGSGVPLFQWTSGLNVLSSGVYLYFLDASDLTNGTTSSHKSCLIFE